MGRVLHVLKGAEPALALATIGGQAADGDDVSVALLHGAPVPPLPPGVRVLHVPDDTSYERLLELIFEADQVVTW
jgi:hypothetical protein